MGAALQAFETFPGVANGALGRLYLHFLCVPHTLQTAESLEQGMRRMHRLYGQGYSLLMLSQFSRPGTPGDPARARLLQTIRETEILPAASALVVTSPGLLGVTGRSVITGLLFMARPP